MIDVGFGQNLFALGRTVLAQLPVPVAETIRAAKRSVLNRRSASAVFSDIFHGNSWDGTESVSGPGSTHAATASIRAQIPQVMAKIGAKSILDIPCGDAYWIGECLPSGTVYTGADIVPAIISGNLARRSELGTFIVRNLVSDPLPSADLALVRDCFIHLPNRMVLAAIENLRRAGIGYMLTTTYPDHATNQDIEIGGFRPVDLTRAPFNLPSPLQLIPDMVAGDRHNKHLGLWRLQ